MKNKLGMAAAFVICGFLVIATPSLAQTVSKNNVNVLRVRAWTDGNMHIDFSQSINSACGGRLRVPDGAGRDRVLTVALAAMMSGRSVTVESKDTPSGNFCNVIYIWLQDT